MRNAADKKQVKDAERRARDARARELSDLAQILDTTHGRRFLRRLVIDVAGVMRSTYQSGPTGRGSDPAFMEGQRNVGLMVLSDINQIDYRHWLLAEAEHLEELRDRGKRETKPETPNNEDEQHEHAD